MKRKYLLLVLAVFVALFALATVKRSDTNPESESAARVEGEKAERIKKFWSAYREATRQRMAGEMSSAAEAYVHALTFDPGHEDALYYLGNVYIELGQWAEAEKTFEHLAEVNPSSARAFSRLGDLKMCFGSQYRVDLEGAQAGFERALQINGEETGPLLRLAETFLLQGHYARALKHFDDASKSNYTSIEAHFFGAYAAWKLQDNAKAGELFEKAINFATPAESAPAVVGEGDRMNGSSPALSMDATCPVIQDALGEFKSQVTASSAPEMNEHFPKLAKKLAQAAG